MGGRFLFIAIVKHCELYKSHFSSILMKHAENICSYNILIYFENGSGALKSMISRGERISSCEPYDDIYVS